MRAINHALTGAIIGLAIEQPAIAYPSALLSHFVCDAIPHHGAAGDNAQVLRSTWFRNSLVIDAAACGLLVLLLAILRPHHWVQAAIGAFLAAAPDFVSIGRYLTVRQGKEYIPNLYTRFASDIQWFERPIGGVVEVVWFVAAAYVLHLFV